MSQLLRTILGPIIPDRPKHDETPVPYRQMQQAPLAPVVDGSLPSEPSEAVTPITENPVNPPQ